MKSVSASSAKQNFGELLEAVRLAPVAIAKHRRVAAIVCSPEQYAARAATLSADSALAERRAAREEQRRREAERLSRHRKIALDLLLMPPAARARAVRGARAEVARWRRDGLCSADYANRWDALLALPAREIAANIASDTLPEGTALRQNSPWLALSPELLSLGTS